MPRRNHQAPGWQPTQREHYGLLVGEDALTHLQPKRALAHHRWMRKHGEPYFLILGDSTVQRFQWHGTEFDHEAWQFGNCFRTHREAERAREVLRQVLWTLHRDQER